MPIQIQTKENLNEEEKETLDRLLNEYYEKIKRELKKDIVINLNLKIYEKGEKGERGKKKYSLNLKIVNSVVFKSDSDDYDLARAIHKAFNKVMREIEHRLHVSNQNKKL